MPRKKHGGVKAGVMAVKARHDALLELAREIAKRPQTPDRNKLLAEVQQTLSVVRVVLVKADDARRWAREVFGEESDDSPLTQFLSNALANSLNATMGQQIYRMQNYLKGRRIPVAPHPAGMLAVSALTELTK
jgi:hypothetical protein